MATAAYGDADIERLPDGRVRVTRADEVIGISVDELLAEADPQWLYVDPDGNLVIAGQVAYAPIGFASDNEGAARIVICRRVWGHADAG